MKPARRELLRRGGALVVLLGARELVWGAGIIAVRVWPADEVTRVTIESDAALSAKHFVADNPARLVVDIDGLELSPALRELVGKVKSDDPFIAGVRVGQVQPRSPRFLSLGLGIAVRGPPVVGRTGGRVVFGHPYLRMNEP